MTPIPKNVNLSDILLNRVVLRNVLCTKFDNGISLLFPKFILYAENVPNLFMNCINGDIEQLESEINNITMSEQAEIVMTLRS